MINLNLKVVFVMISVNVHLVLVSSLKKQKLNYNSFRLHSWKRIEKLTFQGGEVIVCLQNNWLGKITNIPHWLLAINDHEMMHAYTPRRSENFVGFDVIDIPKVQEGFNAKYCMNLGPGDKDRQASIDRAIKWKGQTEWYDVYSCHCRHWVTYWATGDPGGETGNLFNLPVSKRCRLYTIKSNPDPPPLEKVAVRFKRKKTGIFRKKLIKSLDGIEIVD